MAEDQPATASRPGGSIKFYVFGGFRLPKRLDCEACHHDLFIGEA